MDATAGGLYYPRCVRVAFCSQVAVPSLGRKSSSEFRVSRPRRRSRSPSLYKVVRPASPCFPSQCPACRNSSHAAPNHLMHRAPRMAASVTAPLATSATASAASEAMVQASSESAVAFSGASMLSVISAIVGVCVLIGSLLYKIPQVLRIARRRSGEGVSVTMYSLETIGTTFSALYFMRRAFAFSTYGELVFVAVQNVAILCLIVLFEKHNRVVAALAALAYACMVILLLSPSVPLKVLMGLQIAAIPILNLARVPQIILNWRRKGTGQLAPLTLGLQVLGNVARIFTTLASVRDWLMLTGVCVSTLFNSTLVAQWLYYNRNVAEKPRVST